MLAGGTPSWPSFVPSFARFVVKLPSSRSFVYVVLDVSKLTELASCYYSLLPSRIDISVEALAYSDVTFRIGQQSIIVFEAQSFALANHLGQLLTDHLLFTHSVAVSSRYRCVSCHTTYLGGFQSSHNDLRPVQLSIQPSHYLRALGTTVALAGSR